MTEYMLCLLGFMLACLLFSMHSENNQKANSLLAALLLLESGQSFVLLVNYGYLVGEATPASTLLISRLLRGPIFYYYARELLGFRFRLDKSTLIHLIPFVLASTYMLFRTPSADRIGKAHLWWSRIELGTGPDLLFATLVFVITIVSVGAYAIAALRLIHQHQHRLKLQYASYEKVNLYWLKSLCWLQLFVVTCGAVYFLLFPLLPSLNQIPLDFVDFALVSSALFFFFIIFYGFKQPIVFHNPAVESEMGKQLENNTQTELSDNERVIISPDEDRSRQATMTDEEANYFYQLLLNQVESEKLYLDSELKIAKLSEHLGLTVPQISYVINHCANHNFYEFINRYRIEHAQHLAQQAIDEGKKISPAQLADRSGYNTNATFYKHFKIYTGSTPKAYLRALRISQQTC